MFNRFIVIVLIIATFALSAFAADTLSLKVRLEQLNGTPDQTVVYPTLKLSETASFASYFLYSKVSEISTGFKFTKNGAYVWPLVGMLYNSEKGYGTHFRGSMHFGYESKLVEFTAQNMIDIANKRSTNDTYHRWWLQIGDKNAAYHSRFGVGAEVSPERQTSCSNSRSEAILFQGQLSCRPLPRNRPSKRWAYLNPTNDPRLALHQYVAPTPVELRKEAPDHISRRFFRY